MSFRPSFTEPERQLLIDALEFAHEQAKHVETGFASTAPCQRFASRAARHQIRLLQQKLFPTLYPAQKKEST